MMGNFIYEMGSLVEKSRSAMDKKIFYEIVEFIKKYAVTDTVYWYPLCILKNEISVAAYDLDRLYHKIYCAAEKRGFSKKIACETGKAFFDGDKPLRSSVLSPSYHDNKIKTLREILKICNIRMVDSFQMLIPSLKLIKKDMIDLLYEQDSHGYNFPWYDETFYFDESRSWMIYVSHEGTITFTGKKIVEAAKTEISSQYLYGYN